MNSLFTCSVYMDIHCKMERNMKLLSSQAHLQDKREKRTFCSLRTCRVPLSPGLSRESYYSECRSQEDQLLVFQLAFQLSKGSAMASQASCWNYE